LTILASFCGGIRSQGRIHPGRFHCTIGAKEALVEAGVAPQLAGDLEGIDAGLLPPGTLIASTMNFAVMDPA
jgi:hypothetical protein